MNTDNLICFICELIISIKKFIKYKTCKHIMCENCGKSFYEDKIEQGEKNLRCPSYKCGSNLIDGTVKLFVSEMHFNQQQQNSSNKKIDLATGRPINFGKMSTINLKQNLFKIFSQNNVLDITRIDAFFDYKRSKEQFCTKCYEPALFGKNGKNYIKCLNCSNFFCKFCLKNLNQHHFDLSSLNHCKIFFRKKTIKSTDLGNLYCLRSILYYFVIYIISYIILVFGVIEFVKEFIIDLLRPVDKVALFLGKIIYVLMWMILSIPLIVVLWLIIPFFPLIITIYK